MASLMDDDGLVFLRCRQTLFPVSGRSFKEYVRNMTRRELKKLGLPSIPILFFWEAPEKLRNALGWFSYSSIENKAVAISFSKVISGMTLDQLKDTVRHEVAHYYTAFHQKPGWDNNNGHSQAFIEACKLIGCQPVAGGSHLQPVFPLPSHRMPLSEARKAYFNGNLNDVDVDFDTTTDLPLRAIVAYENSDMTSLRRSLMEMKCKENAEIQALWALLSMRLCTSDSERWPFLMALHAAAEAGSVNAQIYRAKTLLEGSGESEPNADQALKHLTKAMQSGSSVAANLWVSILLKHANEDEEELREIQMLIQPDIPVRLEDGLKYCLLYTPEDDGA